MQSRFGLNIILHIIVFIWGFTGILGNIISVDQFVLVWWRMLMALIALLIFILFTKRKLKISSRAFWTYLGIGVIICLHWIFFYGAIKIANVSVSVSCMAVASFFTAILYPLFNRSKIVYYELVLGIGVIVGVSVLMGVEINYLEGFIWGLISAFFAATFTVLNAKMVQSGDSVVISFFEMTGGFLALTVYMFFEGSLHSERLALNNSDLLYLLILSVFCTAIPFVVSVWVMKKLSPYTVSISVNMEPIYTILLALMIWPETEKMSPGFYTGAAIILSTVLANAWLKGRFEKKKAVYS